MLSICTVYAIYNILICLKCSKTCGTGTQRRAAECVDEMGHVMDESNCRETEKIVERICSTQKCPQWSVGEWTPVSILVFNFSINLCSKIPKIYYVGYDKLLSILSLKYHC